MTSARPHTAQDHPSFAPVKLPSMTSAEYYKKVNQYQTITHAMVLEIGAHLADSERDKLEAAIFTEVERAVADAKQVEGGKWRQELERQRSAMLVLHDKELKKVHANVEKLVTTEVLKIENTLQQQAAEQLEEAKELQLEEMRRNIAKALSEGKAALERAVAEARLEEREVTTQRVEEERQKGGAVVADVLRKHAAEREKLIAAGKAAVAEEATKLPAAEKLWRVELAEVVRRHEEDVAQLHDEKKLLAASIEEWRAALAPVEAGRAALREEKQLLLSLIREKHDALVHLVDSSEFFVAGETTYLVPSLDLSSFDTDL